MAHKLLLLISLLISLLFIFIILMKKYKEEMTKRKISIDGKNKVMIKKKK